MSSSSSLAALLPDEPRVVDLRGLLLSERCDVFAGDDPRLGFVARSRDFPFAAASGRPAREVVRRAVAGSAGEWHLLAQPEDADHLAAALPGWGRRGVVIHRYTGSWPPGEGPAPGTDLLLLPEGHAAAGLNLDHLPAELHRELSLEYVASRPMAAAVATDGELGGRPVAFCYAPFITAGLWDVAVDTLEPYRRRGLAGACFRTLAAHLGWDGKRPVWGAMESNTASMRLAAGLGFVPDTRLVSIHRSRA